MAGEYKISSTNETFCRVNHTLGHKPSPNKFKKLEIISSIFSIHNGIKLEASYKKKYGKFIYMGRLNNMLVNNQCIKKCSKEKKYLETKYNVHKVYQKDNKNSLEKTM